MNDLLTYFLSTAIMITIFNQALLKLNQSNQCETCRNNCIDLIDAYK